MVCQFLVALVQLNIEHMAKKSRGEFAYTLLDLSAPMPHDTVEELKKIDGVIRVRRVFEL